MLTSYYSPLTWMAFQTLKHEHLDLSQENKLGMAMLSLIKEPHG
jgi:hypothetical protein